MAIINKKWRKDASNTAVEAALRAVGATLAAVACHEATKTEFVSKGDLQKTIGNIAAPALSILSIAGDIFLEHPYLKAACQGMYSIALVKSASVIAPSIGNYTGLKGVAIPRTRGIMNGYNPGNKKVLTQYTARPQNANQQAFAKVAEYAEKTVNKPTNDIYNANTISGVKQVAESML